jgi:hypothetical protein
VPPLKDTFVQPYMRSTSFEVPVLDAQQGSVPPVRSGHAALDQMGAWRSPQPLESC